MCQRQDSRLAIMSILVYDRIQAKKVNELLHEFGDRIVGRMGLPYKDRDLSVICVVMDATNDEIANVSGRLGRLEGVTCKVLYAKNRQEQSKSNEA